MHCTVQVSPHWYRWLVNMWLAYGGRQDLAGISLQKQTVSVVNENFKVNIAGMVDTPVFLYELSGIGGAIGVSPHPVHWDLFISRHGSQMRTCPPALACSDPDIWEPWWFYYTAQARLFTLYLAHPLTVATQHREKGVHEKGNDTKQDFDFIKDWETCWEKYNLPKEIPRLNLDLGKVSDVIQEARKIYDAHDVVIVTMIGESDIPSVKHPYKHLSPSERQIILDKTLFIVHSTDLLQRMKHLPHLALDRGIPVSNHSDEHLLDIIETIIQQEIRVITLPPGWRGAPGPWLHWVSQRKLEMNTKVFRADGQDPQQLRTSPTMLAGKALRQKSPDMKFMLWDARVEVYRFIQRWRAQVKSIGSFMNFKDAWLEDIRSGFDMKWNWISKDT